MSYQLKFHAGYQLFLSAMSLRRLLIISIFYAIIFKSARKQALSATKLTQYFIASDGHRLYTRKAVCTTFFIVCLFYGTFLPYSIHRIVSTMDKSLSPNDKRTTWRWIIAFTFVNSSINAFIYFIGTKRFRSRFKRLLWINEFLQKRQ